MPDSTQHVVLPLDDFYTMKRDIHPVVKTTSPKLNLFNKLLDVIHATYNHFPIWPQTDP